MRVYWPVDIRRSQLSPASVRIAPLATMLKPFLTFYLICTGVLQSVGTRPVPGHSKHEQLALKRKAVRAARPVAKAIDASDLDQLGRQNRSLKTEWNINAVIRWAAEHREARASPPNGIYPPPSMACLPGTNICCQAPRSQSMGSARGASNVNGSPDSLSSACRRIHECKRDMCNGKLPLTCLMGAGYDGRPTITYANHAPVAKLQRQSGYGVALDRGFRVASQEVSCGGGSSDNSNASVAATRHGLATTGLTDIRFNFGILKAAKYSFVRLVATLHADGASKELCRQARARLSVKVHMRSRDGPDGVRHNSVFQREFGYDNGSNNTRVINETICHGLNNKTSSTCRLILETTLHTYPDSRRNELLGLCWAFWENLHVVIQKEDEPCNNSCTEDLPLTCVKKNRANLNNFASYRKPDTTDCFGRFQQTLLHSKKIKEGDIVVPVTRKGYRFVYNVKSNWQQRRFELLIGQLRLFSPDCLQSNSRIANDSTNQRMTALVTISLGQVEVFQRRLTVSGMSPMYCDQGPVIIKLSQADRNQRLNIHVVLENQVGYDQEQSCGAIVLANPRLTPLEHVLAFGGCQGKCFNQISSTSSTTTPLSCFLGRKRDGISHPFACPGQITRHDDLNMFMQIDSYNQLARIGVDSPGRWQQSSKRIELLYRDANQTSRRIFTKAIGAHPDSRINVNLTAFRAAGMSFTHFTSKVGIDISSGCAPNAVHGVQFRILLDGQLHYSTDVFHAWDTKRIFVEVRNSYQMTLITLYGRLRQLKISKHLACTAAVWADPMLQSMARVG